MTKRIWLLAVLLGGCAASQESAPVAPESPKWPRAYENAGDRMVVYPPEVDGGWPDHRVLHARSALVVTPSGSREDAYGVAEYEVKTEVNLDTREVLFKDRKLTAIRFPGKSEDAAKEDSAVVQRLLEENRSFIVPLDFVLAYLKKEAQKSPSVKLNLDPPPIFDSEEPAILINFMGKPSFKPVPGLTLQFATNTNWDLFYDPNTSQYFLLNGQGWISTRNLEQGPWAEAQSVPEDLWKLPADPNWQDIRGQLPGKHVPVPHVYISLQPAELILTEGPPVYESIPGTRLSFISNTASDLFYDEEMAKYYFLTSGRWFRSDRLEGPWSAATLDLPADFAKIPRTSAKADVLASVPGTQEAEDAVLLAQVPHRATIRRNEVSLTVSYEGNPEFRVIEGTKVEYAPNTPYDVFFVNGGYYCCHQAVWFQAASSEGPWAVCSSVPLEIYTIPSSSPFYPVTYVRVYESTPDTVVVGCTAGYAGMYVASGVLMFGLGMAVAYDQPFAYYHYGPGFYAYGCGAHYSYHIGGYYAGARVYGPYGGAAWGARYNPATGTYVRGAAAQGTFGHRYFAEAYNPYTGRYSARSGGSTPYSKWGHGVTVQGDSWARGGYYRDARGSAIAGESSGGGRAIAARGGGGQTAIAGRTAQGDLYAGRNGNVYRKSGDEWQHYSAAGGWSNVQDHDTSRTLQDSAAARDRGWANTDRRIAPPARLGGGFGGFRR